MIASVISASRMSRISIAVRITRMVARPQAISTMPQAMTSLSRLVSDTMRAMIQPTGVRSK